MSDITPVAPASHEGERTVARIHTASNEPCPLPNIASCERPGRSSTAPTT